MRNKQKLIIAGSPARILNSNYFYRKIDKYKQDFDIILVMDSYVFHDKKEDFIKLSDYKKVKKDQSNCEWQSFLELKVRYYSKILGGFKLIKWNKKKSSKKFIGFINSINSDLLCLDITKCPICGKSHIGPLKVNNGIIEIGNEKIKLKNLSTLNCRIKYGYLQLYMAKLLNNKVLLSKKFYDKNIGLIKKLKLNKNVLIDSLSEKNQIKLNDYVDDLYNIIKIPYRSRYNVVEVIKNVGVVNFLRIIKRDNLRKMGKFNKADKIRVKLGKRDIRIEDGKNISYIIIRRRKR